LSAATKAEDNQQWLSYTDKKIVGRRPTMAEEKNDSFGRRMTRGRWIKCIRVDLVDQ
jgi:hypothetical protein